MIIEEMKNMVNRFESMTGADFRPAPEDAGEPDEEVLEDWRNENEQTSGTDKR